MSEVADGGAVIPTEEVFDGGGVHEPNVRIFDGGTPAGDPSTGPTAPVEQYLDENEE